MRDVFTSFNQLYGYYVFVKYDLVSIRSLLPTKHLASFRNPSNNGEWEYKACFVGDVELYMDNLHLCDSEVLHIYITTPITFRELADYLRKNRYRLNIRKNAKDGKGYSLFDDGNLNKYFWKINREASMYFIENGYIDKKIAV